MNQLHDELLTAHKACLGGWPESDDPIFVTNHRYISCWEFWSAPAFLPGWPSQSEMTPFLPESPLDAHCEAFVAGGQGEVPVLVGNLKEGLPVKSMTPWQWTTYILSKHLQSYVDRPLEPVCVESHGLGDTKPFWCGGSAAVDVCPVPLQHLMEQILSWEIVLWASMKMSTPKGFH